MGVDPWCLEQLTMDAAFSSVCCFPEGNLEELRQKLVCATVELQALRANAKEEMRKREESMEQLFHLLQVIAHERDVARHQLQLLLTARELCPPQARSSSGLTESDSYCETWLGNNVVRSPPESSSLKTVINGSSNSNSSSNACPTLDKVCAVIGGLAMEKPLPQKGKLLQAVLEAGPTLQSLLLAGPLPQWRNPPPLQPFHLPPLSVKAHRAIHGSSPSEFSHGLPAMKRWTCSEGLCVKSRERSAVGVRDVEDVIV